MYRIMQRWRSGHALRAVMATSIDSPPRNISSSVALLDNVSHYEPFLCRSLHSLEIKAPLIVQEQRIFTERFNVSRFLPRHKRC
jgi:hypothetical protein